MSTLNILIEDPEFIALDDKDKLDVLRKMPVPDDIDKVHVTWKETEVIRVLS